MSPSELEDLFRALRHEGLRITQLKREVVELFASGACGLSAGDLIEAIDSDVRRSSVYRCLGSLVAAGFLCRARTSDGVFRYRVGRRFAGHHDHFLCSSCGARQMIEGALPDILLRQLERQYGFRVAGFDLELEGQCGKCLERRLD